MDNNLKTVLICYFVCLCADARSNPASSSRGRKNVACCSCWRPKSSCHRGDSLSLMSEMYCRLSEGSCAHRAPIGPPDAICPCVDRQRRPVPSLLEQSEYEVAGSSSSPLSRKKNLQNANYTVFEMADDVKKIKSSDISSQFQRNSNKNKNKNNVNFSTTECELADDAISLNEIRPANTINLKTSPQSNNKSESVEFITVNGKEELPSPEYRNNQEMPLKTDERNIQSNNCINNKIDGVDLDIELNVKVNITLNGKQMENDNDPAEKNKYDVVTLDKLNLTKDINNIIILEDSDDTLLDLDGNRNRLTVPPASKNYSTFPKRKRDSVNHRMWYRPVLEPPHRVTPDGTDIYYWCDMPKRLGQGKINKLPHPQQNAPIAIATIFFNCFRTG